MEPTTLQAIPQTPTNEPPPAAVDPVKAVADNRSPQEKLAEITAEFNRQIQAPPVVEAPAPVAEPAQPVQPQAPENPPEVPEKFKNPDGTPNAEKIQQSTVNIEQALARYREKEKEFTKQRQQQTVQQVQATTTPEPVPQTFEEQINADLQREGPAKVLAKLFNAAKEAARSEVLFEVRGLQQEVELSKRDKELETLAAHDPFVLTEEGINALAKIRTEKPWLNQSPRPWESAYRDYLAEQSISRRAVPQVIPTPRGMTAPVAPAVPVARAPSSPTPNGSNMTKAQISEHLAGKSASEVAAFYRGLGLPFDIGWTKKKG